MSAKHIDSNESSHPPLCSYPSCTLHCLCHLLITSKRLNSQGNSLQLSPHLIKLLYMSTSSHQIPRLNLASRLFSRASWCQGYEKKRFYKGRRGAGGEGGERKINVSQAKSSDIPSLSDTHHLPILCTLFDIDNQFFFLLLQFCPFSIQFSLRLL